jgi:hypothetical protein
MPLNGRQASVTRAEFVVKGMQHDGAGSGQEQITLLSCLALASINLPKRAGRFAGFCAGNIIQGFNLQSSEVWQ